MITSIKEIDAVEELNRTNESGVEKDLVVAEYNNLRAEIVSRLGIRYHMIQFALAGLGTLLTISFSSHNAFLLLSYPALALVLSVTYITNSYESRRMAHYIKEKIESRVVSTVGGDTFGWQHYRKSPKMERFGTLGNIGAKAILSLTAFLAVGAGALITTYNTVGIAFMSGAFLICLIIGVLLFFERRFLPKFL